MDEKKKKWMFIPLILTAIGGPYAAFSGDVGKLLSSFSKSAEQSQPAFPMLGDDFAYTNSATYVGTDGQAAIAPTTDAANAPRLSGPVVEDLAAVIRFDISPRWVAQYWSRVSTVTSELELEGLRVPLVTGPRPDDIAGSLTYYFDKYHTVQRVTFHGSTGDERRLVTLLTGVYGFKEQPSLNGGMYVTTWNGKPTSLLRIEYAPVVRATTPNSQKQIAFEINRPGEFNKLSQEMQALISKDAHVRRW